MNNLFKRVFSMITGGVLFASSITPLVCSAQATIDNDGKMMDLPFGDSKIPASFKDVQYYDCYVPYAETYGTIGGYAVDGNSVLWAKEHKDEIHIGDKATWENDMFNWSSSNNYWNSYAGAICGNTSAVGVTQGYEEDTGMAIVKDKNGTTYYITALQFFFTSYLPDEKRSDPSIDIRTGKGGYYGFGLYCNAGQIIDVILTDGTVIHFAVGDAAGREHCNGGDPSGEYGNIDAVSYSGMERDILNKHKQYTNIFQAGGGNMLELWGKDGSSLSRFCDKYNLKYDGSGNHVAYYRMYNAMVKDAPTLATADAKNVAYSLGGVKFEKGSNNNSGEPVQFTVNGMSAYDEAYFVTAENTPKEYSLVLLGSDSLTCYEQEQLYYWKQNLSLKAEQQAKSVPRVMLMVVAIVIIAYALTLLVFHQMDILNSFVDIEFLGMITMKKMKAVRTEDLRGNSNTMKFTEGKYKVNGVWYVTLREILTVDVALISISVYILSGRMFLHLNNLTDLVLDFLGKIF